MKQSLFARQHQAYKNIVALEQELNKLNERLEKEKEKKQLLETQLQQKAEAIKYLESLDEDVLVEALEAMQNRQQTKEERENNPLLNLDDEERKKYIQKVYRDIKNLCQENEGSMDLHEYRDEIVPDLPRSAQDAIIIELEKQNKIAFEAYEDIDPKAIRKYDEELEAGIEYEIHDEFTYVSLSC